MKLNEVAFRGYQAYSGDANFQRLNLSPLTLLFGKNNSGKSAAIRLPRLVLGGLECNDGRVLPMEVRGLSYGSRFLDLVPGGDFFGRPTFQISAEHKNENLDFAVTLFSQGALAADEPPHVWSYEMRAPEKLSIPAPPTRGDTGRIFKGLLPPEDHWNSWRKAAGATLDEMIHLGPTRARVESIYSNRQFVGFDFHGSQVPQLLRLNDALADEVGSWYATHMDGWRLSLKRDSESFSLQISRNSRLSSNLANGGEGLQQVLPVVVQQLWRQNHNFVSFLDIVEQPELHLHPAAQPPLADLFIATALKGHGQTLVETNSQGILLRLQRRVAEGVLPKEMVNIYFVELTDDGSELKRIHLDSSGELDWWPSGVFEEDFSEVAAMRRAQRAKNSGKAS